ncbi:P-loop NTPase fold protein [Methanococcus maripaludis]|uniref:ABC-type dipeptide/oligopeptide/nickel transport system ATPase component n=1 Tax=Methanococcus maripaludis TaxID=39152 RepID=A0A7J9PCI4_METMI|nr:P-loop NTPase fold protein [Methanococcus maripaludis]MBA2860942.1 ABC-type dipeptide/oligopeptide/nickel transport system ATPase component [Methanococcus maripaludis]
MENLENSHSTLSDGIAKTDKLNRKDFCNNLGDLLINYTNEDKDGLVIGLYGEWGSGKSTIIDMTKNYVDKQIKDLKEKPLIFVEFNPWYFSDHDLLISKFFEKLSLELGRKDQSKVFGEASKLLNNLSKGFAYLRYIPAISEFGKCAGDLLSGFSELFNKISEEYSGDFEAVKKDIDKLLENQNQKIVVIIDDIDRLNSAEVRQIFQLVKCLADFKNVIYILPFDQKIVSKALEKSQEGYGEQYLEKIIQLPLTVPLAHKIALKTMIDEGIEKITKIDFKKEYVRDYSKAYQKSLFYMVKNVRDVKRFLNILRINWNLIDGKNVYPIDFILITAIQVFIPKLYDLIKHTKLDFVGHYSTELDILTPRTKHYIEPGSSYADQPYYNRYISEIIPKLAQNYDKWNVYDLLDMLFPTVGLNSLSVTYDPIWGDTKRIASEVHFENYFLFENSESLVPNNCFELLISNDFSKTKFTNILQNFADADKLKWYVYELEKYIGRIRPENLNTIMESLMEIEMYSKPEDINGISEKIAVYMNELVVKHKDDARNKLYELTEYSGSGCTLVKIYEDSGIKPPNYNYFSKINTFNKAEIVLNYLTYRENYGGMVSFFGYTHPVIFNKLIAEMDEKKLSKIFEASKSMPNNAKGHLLNNFKLFIESVDGREDIKRPKIAKFINQHH